LFSSKRRKYSLEILHLNFECWVETGATRRKTTQEDADLQSICDLPFNSAEALALAGSLTQAHLISSLKAQ